MSWFSVEKLKQNLNADTLRGLQEKVKNAVPKIDNAMLQKLTLTTPEMNAFRQRIDEEERHKDRVRNILAGMMPWETRDPERDILVEECKEAILKLSHAKQNFYGPYLMPSLNVKLDEDEEDEEGEGEEGGETLEEVEEKEDFSEEPTKEQLEKLKTLSPLPPRLEEFELDAHVGLIQKLLKVDKELVEMQSTLSGGGERERTFWRNYFFHCAWCRYEAGLSIDEIWSDEQPPAASSLPNDGNESHTSSTKEELLHEQEITFEKHDEENSTSSDKPSAAATADAPVPVREVAASSKEIDTKETTSGTGAAAEAAENAEFEMVGEADGDDMLGEPAVDYELDELEAEIARELEN